MAVQLASPMSHPGSASACAAAEALLQQLESGGDAQSPPLCLPAPLDGAVRHLSLLLLCTGGALELLLATPSVLEPDPAALQLLEPSRCLAGRVLQTSRAGSAPASAGR